MLISQTVEVDVEVEIDEFDTDELIDEIERRGYTIMEDGEVTALNALTSVDKYLLEKMLIIVQKNMTDFVDQKDAEEFLVFLMRHSLTY